MFFCTFQDHRTTTAIYWNASWGDSSDHCLSQQLIRDILMRNVNHSCNIEALDSLLRKDVIAQKLVWPSPLSRICFVVRGLRCRIFWCWLNGIPLEKLAYKCKQKNAGSVNLHKLGWCLHNQWFLIKWKCCQLTLMNLSTKVSHISKIS